MEDQGGDRNSQRYERTRMQKEMVMEKLRQEGCRITRQRRLILDIVLQEDCSCCKEIFYKVQEKDKNIGPATVYRMVNALEKVGAISRKNMYRITDTPVCCKDKGCSVRLTDNTVCNLPPRVWKEVMTAGLKEYGYIKEQEIDCIEITA